MKEKMKNIVFLYDRVYLCPQEPFMIDDTLSKNVALSDTFDVLKSKRCYAKTTQAMILIISF